MKAIPSDPVRFWAKVEEAPSGCWLWTASLNNAGYGRFWSNGHHRLAHRFAYEQIVSPIDTGFQIDHLCRTRDCVNPAHLEAVTPAENTRRGSLAKLTADEVAQVRTSDASLRTLAARYGVTDGAIAHIRTGRNWRAA